MVQTNVIYSDKRNAFLMLLEHFFDFGLQKPSFSIGFIRYVTIGFCVLKRLNFPLFYNGFARVAKV